MSQGPLLDAEGIRRLLIELGGRLTRRGLEARLFVVDGAAMALAFNRERVTRDIDAVFEPKTEVYAEAARMADERGLPSDWLNDGVKGLMPDRQEAVAGVEFVAPGIAVQVASAEYLFAMKAQAARAEADLDDLRLLVRHLGLRTVDGALDLVERFYTASRVPPKTSSILDEAIASAWSDGG